MKKFLLHTCCGPCGIAIYEKLSKEFDLTAYYYNPNIFPPEEYRKRLQAVVNSADIVPAVKLFEGKYEPERWLAICSEYKSEPEGGKRCELCFRMRMEETVRSAKENGFDLWGTTITSGRNKKASIINAIGLELAEKYNVPFYEADWKKGGGQERSREICNAHDIYRQDYCGCVYSIRK